MARSYRRVDRDQRFLLPPDMAEWLPPGHLVWFVLEVVAQLDTAVFHRLHPNSGPGRAAYDPDMMLALLIYAYASGERSSRQIERLCGTDVGYRVICAQDAPDHTKIARFRADHQDAFAGVFTQVLALCAAAGMGRVGVIAIDGTKIAANASLGANHTEAWLQQELQQEIGRILAEAAATDAREDEQFGPLRRGDELPEPFADPRTRVGRIRAALEQVQGKRRRAEQQDRAARAKAEEYLRRVEAGETPRGRPPAGIDELRLAQARLKREQHRLHDRDPEQRKKAKAALPKARRRLRRAEAKHAWEQADAATRPTTKPAPTPVSTPADEGNPHPPAADATTSHHDGQHTEAATTSTPGTTTPGTTTPGTTTPGTTTPGTQLLPYRPHSTALLPYRPHSTALLPYRPASTEPGPMPRPTATPADRPHPADQPGGSTPPQDPHSTPGATGSEGSKGSGRATANLTDPDSRVMATKQGWLQGYNAQLAVSDDHLILAAIATADPTDTLWFEPMLAAATGAVEVLAAHRPTPAADHPEPLAIGTVLADAGYHSEHNLTCAGPDRLIALGTNRDLHRDARTHPTSGPPPDHLSATEQMRHRLRTPEGRTTYKRRAATVEPVNGHVKDGVGLRRFSRRGLPAVTAELHFAATVVNLLKLRTHIAATTTTTH